jgi:hypothetical protein
MVFWGRARRLGWADTTVQNGFLQPNSRARRRFDLGAAGADMKGLDFKSVMPMIRDAGKSQYDSVYGAPGIHNQRAVIDGDHKMPESTTLSG